MAVALSAVGQQFHLGFRLYRALHFIEYRRAFIEATF